MGLDDESFRTTQIMGLAELVKPHTTPQHIMRLANGAGRTILETIRKPWSPAGTANTASSSRKSTGCCSRDCHGSRGCACCSATRLRPLKKMPTASPPSRCSRPPTGEGNGVFGHSTWWEGVKSPTRNRLGVSFEGESPSNRWLVVDVKNDPLGTPNVFLGADPKRPYVSIGLPHAVRRFEFMLHEDETEEQATDPDFVNLMHKDHATDPSSLEFIRRRVFAHHGRVAGSFHGGRQLIAGDAAHLMPVWLGQGWNSGMRDATNLGWKLSSILRGAASDALLDTYTLERRDHGKAMGDLSLTFGAAIKLTNRRWGASFRSRG